MQLAADCSGDLFGPHSLDERQIAAGFEQISGVRKDLREIHLEKNALCDNRVIPRRRPMSQELFTSGRSAEPLSESRKEYWIRLYRSHIPAERCHSCGGIADAGTYF